MTTQRFQSDAVLAQLKDFQRASVDRAFGALYEEGASRFLVADEVGLGKTMVARGVISRAIEHLWRDVERIDVIYICSNASIAQQNIRRLNVMPDQGFSFSSRMTMIARDVSQLDGNKVNFVSFTPGTSFDLKSNTGMSGERVLLYWMLHHIWGEQALAVPGGQRFFKCTVSDEHWPRYLAEGRIDRDGLNEQLLVEFEQDLISLDARARFDEWAPAFAVDDTTSHDENLAARYARNDLIGALRERLARRCVDALEPDLVILDEFQRFRDLMSGESEAGQLAQSLFNYEGNKTLLLSATPYKAFTTSDDDDDDHHRDFVETVRFLFNGRANRFEPALAEFRSGLLNVDRLGVVELGALRRAVESELRKVMVRTERLGAGGDRNGMLTEVTAAAPLTPSVDDIVSYVGLERLAAQVEGQSTIEFWKSVPSFVNFTDGYKVDEQIEQALVDGRAASTRSALRRVGARIDWQAWRRFDPIESDSPRLRLLQQQAVDNEAWRMLWLAPSLPYYELGEPWTGDRQEFTKRLIFSKWGGVPKSVSSLLSYEVERRMFGLRDEPIMNTPAMRQSIRGLLPFNRDREGRAGSMNSFAFVYPSPTLARIGDPLALARKHGRLMSLPELAVEIRREIVQALAEVDDIVEFDAEHRGPDLRWYWAAPILFDRAGGRIRRMGYKWQGRAAWLGGRSAEGDDDVDPDDTSGAINERFGLHIDLAAEVYRDELALGDKPADLVDVLVEAALGSPATVALRSLTHVFGEELAEDQLWEGACRIGWAFRSLFNLPDVNSMVRSAAWDQEYWRTAVRYCADGCLTAVLDEYLHVLRESLGLFDINPDDPGATMEELTAAFDEAVGIRTSSFVARDHLGEADIDNPRLRTRFAMRFGSERSESDTSVVTASHLRQAFNSPFWPFVLTSTSVGQEGLDFHLYCHAIMHWNLPSNPVDLEQREGRVHRYKGHAVRRNLASTMAESAWSSTGDPWRAMFDEAAATRAESDNELVPYWVYPGRYKIERHVPALPLSKEVAQLARLKRGVARYRLVFGQPRQDDLMEYLGELAVEKSEQLRIDLSP